LVTLHMLFEIFQDHLSSLDLHVCIVNLLGVEGLSYNYSGVCLFKCNINHTTSRHKVSVSLI
jgi:hypothetical protein